MPVMIDTAIKSFRLSLIKQSHQKYIAKNPHKKTLKGRESTGPRTATDVLIDACFQALKREQSIGLELSVEEKALCGII